MPGKKETTEGRRKKGGELYVNMPMLCLLLQSIELYRRTIFCDILCLPAYSLVVMVMKVVGE